MPQAKLLTDLGDAFAFAQGIIIDAHTTDSSGQFTKPANIRAFMTEAAILKAYIAWERYLEQSFLHYLTGTASTSGKTLVCYLKPPSIEHASLILIGTQRYVDWSNPQVVLQLAKLYFHGGEPYQTTISSVYSDLYDLRMIRNAAAHLSTTTSDKLDQVALRKLGRATTGITVYDLVTATSPSDPSKSILQTYIDLLTAAATQISRA